MTRLGHRGLAACFLRNECPSPLKAVKAAESLLSFSCQQRNKAEFNQSAATGNFTFWIRVLLRPKLSPRAKIWSRVEINKLY